MRSCGARLTNRVRTRTSSGPPTPTNAPSQIRCTLATGFSLPFSGSMTRGHYSPPVAGYRSETNECAPSPRMPLGGTLHTKTSCILTIGTRSAPSRHEGFWLVPIPGSMRNAASDYRRKLLLRTWVNKGKKRKDRSCYAPALAL